MWEKAILEDDAATDAMQRSGKQRQKIEYRKIEILRQADAGLEVFL